MYILKRVKIYYLIISFIIVLVIDVFANKSIYTYLSDVRFSDSKDRLRLVFVFNRDFVYSFRVKNQKSLITLKFLNLYIPDDVADKLEDIKDKVSIVKLFNLSSADYITNIDIYFSYPIYAKYKIFKLKSPYRLVLDVYKRYSLSYSYDFLPYKWRVLEVADIKGYSLFNIVSSITDIKNVDICKAKKRAYVKQLSSKCNSIVAINGTFFAYKDGKPLGLLVKNFKILAKDVKRRPPRSCFVILKDNRLFIDRLYTKGDKIYSLSNNKEIKNARLIISGGPTILKNSKIYITDKQEEFSKGGNDITRKAARTVIALNKRGISFLTVSGFFSNRKDGIKFKRLALYLKKLGYSDAMCLDGGTSTSMVYFSQLISKPGYKFAKHLRRKISNILYIKNVKEFRQVNFDIELIKREYKEENNTAIFYFKILNNKLKGKIVPVRFYSNKGDYKTLHFVKVGSPFKIAVKLKDKATILKYILKVAFNKLKGEYFIYKRNKISYIVINKTLFNWREFKFFIVEFFPLDKDLNFVDNAIVRFNYLKKTYKINLKNRRCIILPYSNIFKIEFLNRVKIYYLKDNL